MKSISVGLQIVIFLGTVTNPAFADSHKESEGGVTLQSESQPPWVETLVSQELNPLDRRLTRIVANFVIDSADSKQNLKHPVSASQAVECVMSAFGDLTTREKQVIASSSSLEAGMEKVIEFHPALQFEFVEDVKSCTDS